jgi:fructuronate reductase
VDRMVPATAARDLADVADRLGLLDVATVVAERHRSWVVEAAEGLPPLADVGVDVVADVEPYQRRKLWLLNGPHSTLAYAGLVAGCTTIADAAVHPLVAPFVRRLVDDILAVADLPPALDTHAFACAALRRFRNPALGHTCVQVGADGSPKLPQRLLPAVAERRRRGLDTCRFAVVAAAWIAATAGIPVRGATLPAVDDPAAEHVRAAAGTGDLTRVCATALGPNGDRGFMSQVSSALRRLVRDGAGALESWP